MAPSKDFNEIGIKEIHVEGLFGHYDYSLPKKNEVKDLSKLFILYGDNGSGKTTVLKLIFYLLSTRDKSGYKTKLAQTKFKKFAIKLSNDIEIGAYREDNYYGSYFYYIKSAGRYVHKLFMKTIDGHSIAFESGSEEDVKFHKILKYIRELNISIYFLSEDRKSLSSIFSSDHDDDHDHNVILTQSDLELARKYERIRSKKNINEKRISLELTVDRFIDWIRKQVIASSNMGESNTISIYNELIKSINLPREKYPPITVLKKGLKDLEKQSGDLASIGLIAPLDFREIKASINSVEKENQEAMLGVLHLFLNSTRARLNALQGLYDDLRDFIDSINKFYTNKTVSFDLNSGFKFLHKSGDKLELGMLSSGEKQLLLLFINAITASDQATIFIIDEPEISLNVKWQRMLLQNLLKFSSKSNIQFIIATHSIELLAPNKDNVTKLEEV